MSETANTAANENDVIHDVSLNKIAPYAISITNIRGFDPSAKAQHALQLSIAEHGQISPILIRPLRKDEQNDDCPDAVFGILEGHHRYEALKALGKNTIRATIVQSDTDAQDLLILAQSNIVGIKWTDYQKGELIDTFMHLTKTTAKDAGKKLFGLDKSRAYQLHKIYREHQQCAEGIVATIPTQKRRKKSSADYDRNKLLATLQKFTPAEDFSTIGRDQELANVKELSQQLKAYAQQLMAFQASPQQDSDSTVVARVSAKSSATESSPKPKKTAIMPPKLKFTPVEPKADKDSTNTTSSKTIQDASRTTFADRIRARRQNPNA